MSNKFNIEPNEFPKCISCDSSHDVNIEEVCDKSKLKDDLTWKCYRCGIQWKNGNE